MPQNQTISDDSVKAFQSLDENGQRTALAAMPPAAKQALLEHLNAGTDPTRGAAQATAVKPRTWRDDFKSKALEGATWLPAIGGAAGGIVGGVGGAAAGGVAGKAGQRLLETAIYGKEPTKQTGTEAATELAKAGGEQAAYEVGGKVLGKGVKALSDAPGERWAARPLNRLLRTPANDLAYASDAMNPGIALARQAPPVATGKYGMRKFIADRITNLTTTRDAKVATLARQGATVDLQAPVSQVLQDAAKNPKEYERADVVKALAKVEKRLTSKPVPGSYIQTPSGRTIPLRVPRLQNMRLDDALKFRQAIDEEIKGFDPNTQQPLKRALQKVYITATDAIHRAAPDIAKDDEAIHQLIYGREGMTGRIQHLERGTVETSAGKGGEEKIMSKLHVPGTRTTPYYVASSKARRVLHKAAGAGDPATIKQIPRVLAGGGEPTPPPDDEE